MPNGIYDHPTAAPTSIPLMEQVQHLWTGTEYETIRNPIKVEILQIPSPCDRATRN